MRPEQLLAEVEDVLHTMPTREEFYNLADALLPWVGRAAAVIRRWNSIYSVDCDRAFGYLRSDILISDGVALLTKLLWQARADLRMEVGQLSVVIQRGHVFDYFNELRKVIETARVDVFFVDPFLSAEFVAQYLPHVVTGVSVRLLGRKHMAALLPAVDLFAQQSHLAIQVRSSASLHDRYVFVDRSACYLSGASFQDGARSAPAVLTQISDAFQKMLDTYEALWTAGKVERG